MARCLGHTACPVVQSPSCLLRSLLRAWAVGELCVSSLPREPRRRSGFLGEARLDHSPASSANPRLCHLSGFPSSAPWEQRTKGHVPDLIRAGLSPCQLQEAAAGVGAVPGRDGQPRHGLSLCLWGREGGRQAEAFEQSCRGALLHRGSASVAETFKSKGGGASGQSCWPKLPSTRRHPVHMRTRAEPQARPLHLCHGRSPSDGTWLPAVCATPWAVVWASPALTGRHCIYCMIL